MRNGVHEQTICEAIKQNRLIEFTYEPTLEKRKFAPDIVHYAKADRQTTLAGGRKKAATGWEQRSYDPNKMLGVVILDEKFEPDPRFDPTSSRYKHGIICKRERV
ncbi:hypothetical protein [Euryhalocaulis caribicus]|uniref:hypothetical protein n=1 Tax=Euryhalocaulis caribicus TaxID=1161401 RepID=UPI0003B31A9B|nr:hypothetical protein [Euryhalocaulis caribicus]